jgi:hypothetical protein
VKHLLEMLLNSEGGHQSTKRGKKFEARWLQDAEAKKNYYQDVGGRCGK